jgi:hypothetical protein
MDQLSKKSQELCESGGMILGIDLNNRSVTVMIFVILFLIGVSYYLYREMSALKKLAETKTKELDITNSALKEFEETLKVQDKVQVQDQLQDKVQDKVQARKSKDKDLDLTDLVELDLEDLEEERPKSILKNESKSRSSLKKKNKKSVLIDEDLQDQDQDQGRDLDDDLDDNDEILIG